MNSSAPVAVFCGSALGKQPAFQHAARSVGYALAEFGHPLIYGGGQKGLMGLVSGAVLEKGGNVTGIIPYAMAAAGGEGSKTEAKEAEKDPKLPGDEEAREKMEIVLVDSMHERKLEMASRAGGFIGLPGGFGTFEEILEVTTWNQLCIQSKPVILLNVHGFYNPLKLLVSEACTQGFVPQTNESLIIFVDGPVDTEETYDWGVAAVEALRRWTPPQINVYGYDWTKSKGEEADGEGERAEKRREAAHAI